MKHRPELGPRILETQGSQPPKRIRLWVKVSKTRSPPAEWVKTLGNGKEADTLLFCDDFQPKHGSQKREMLQSFHLP